MSKAIFTEVRRDIYLETWLKYYSHFFNDIYLVNTNPDQLDSYIEKAKNKYKFVVIKDYPNPEWSMEISRNHIKDFQRKLLEKYNWVLFAHADEFIVPDPNKYRGLGDYIRRCEKDYVFCSGYDILQMYQEKDGELDEPALDLTKSILKQRKYWLPTKSYCKPLLSRVPLNWAQGFHRIDKVEDGNLEEIKDKDLYLCHLKCADYTIFGERQSTGKGIGADKGYDWFYKEHDKRELIPERVKVF